MRTFFVPVPYSKHRRTEFKRFLRAVIRAVPSHFDGIRGSDVKLHVKIFFRKNGASERTRDVYPLRLISTCLREQDVNVASAHMDIVQNSGVAFTEIRMEVVKNDKL